MAVISIVMCCLNSFKIYNIYLFITHKMYISDLWVFTDNMNWWIYGKKNLAKMRASGMPIDTLQPAQRCTKWPLSSEWSSIVSSDPCQYISYTALHIIASTLTAASTPQNCMLHGNNTSQSIVMLKHFFIHIEKVVLGIFRICYSFYEKYIIIGNGTTFQSTQIKM